MTTSSGAQIITIWELYGCGMEQIAAQVAAELNLPVHGQAFSSEQIEASMAERERGGAFGRFLRSLSPAVIPSSASGDVVLQEVQTVEDTARQVTTDVNGFADHGGVILGRNGAFLLHSRPGSLHVKLIGEVGARVARAAGLYGIEAERSARRQPLEDEFRRELSLQVFRFDPAGDDYYDLVIDTTRFTTEQVVALIVAAAKARASA